MKRAGLSFLFTLLVLAGCNTYNQKNYKQYQGISYEQYEKERQRQEAQKLETLEGVEETDIQDTGFYVEYDEFGNEVIESTGNIYGEAVVVMATKKIYLSRDASNKDLPVFQKALDAAYQTALKEYRPTGFTYSISPAGPVNPLAILDVQCILGETSANSAIGRDTCEMFFKEIAVEYPKMKAEEQAAATAN